MTSISMPTDRYTVGWICALPRELAAAKAVLDEVHESPRNLQPNDDNTYILGRIQQHYVTIASLPAGQYGIGSAATAAQQMRSSFKSIRFGLLVGIGGGIPTEDNDIRLGDVVVGQPSGQSGGVIQYDLGKDYGTFFERTGFLNAPPAILLNVLNALKAEHKLQPPKFLDFLATVVQRYPIFSHPGVSHDVLHESGQRRDTDPVVHYGLIASGNKVIKDATARDQMRQELGDILCFEMEAAGLINNFPCLVIRGISDYADYHKNDYWQDYAAIVAACYAKELLYVVQPREIEIAEKASSIIHHKQCQTVPFDRNPRFIGRQSKVDQLHKMVFAKNRNSPRKAAITGLGGMGKTQVALELAYSVQDQDPTLSVFWIPSTSIEAIEQAFMSISEQLQLQNVTAANVKSQVKAYLSSEMAGSWLLIIDNADDADIWMKSSPSLPALKTFLPQNRNGFILFTTRNQQLATQLVGPGIIRLSELDDVMAIDLLKASLINPDLTKDHETTTTLVRQLCGLPLALSQAASFINENDISLEAYLSLLNQQGSAMIELLSEEFEDEFRYPDIKNPVASTWLVSFQQIQKSSDMAAQYLSFMACIEARDIPLSLLPPAESNIEQQKALGILKAYAFITMQSNSHLINMHRLVHLAIRNWLQMEDQLLKWVVKAIEHFNDIFPSDDHHNRGLWREYLPHAQFILQNKVLPQGVEVQEEFAQCVGRCLFEDGRYREAEVLFQAVYKARHGRPGRWKEAEELEVQVIEISKRVLGAEHPDTLRSMGNLADTLKSLKRNDQAIALLEDCLQLREKKIGSTHPDTIETAKILQSWRDSTVDETPFEQSLSASDTGPATLPSYGQGRGKFHPLLSLLRRPHQATNRDDDDDDVD
ncbi:hypothetical protein ASPZODRAFT_104127 [Penicilliopsis zonata CBS 506.65]|uniref:NB-ARC domain-containing protein n=1 Tax=Penicilliopsis zonata CBS 506.65 TaxID=1073090 RepID=A0A1L9S6V9_9EURO|nr:hypothetical protein ASPZODRAFT_104127 [Penicilliopsis zonata CBS 506.65]OJJ42892.1 hypothetical protein ASPZODRAFT_104127 [Penicilliopsis zonata CBS 506.65]